MDDRPAAPTTPAVKPLTYTRIRFERRSMLNAAPRGVELLVLILTAEDGETRVQTLIPLPVSRTSAGLLPDGDVIYHWTGTVEKPSLFPDVEWHGLRARLVRGVLRPTPLNQERMLRQPVRVTS